MPEIPYNFYRTTSEAWDSMYQALSQAKKSIYWEVYIFVDDEIGTKFLGVLAEKARAGVEVKLIIDAFGSTQFSAAAEKFCEKAGVEILKYNRMYPELRIWSWLTRLLHRNHRKVLIIDEEIVFLGGVNVKDEFHSWDDIYVKIEGKIGRPLLRGFAKSYVSAGGKKTNVRRFLHPKLLYLPEWRKKIRFIVHSGTGAYLPRSKRFYLKAIAMAKESVNLLTPYYAPDPQFLRAIALARRRGVKVNIFLPLRIDLGFMSWIARSFYELTIKSGANIYLLPAMHHGKALSVDDKLGLVGSINLVPSSFSRNEETAVSFTDENMVRDLNLLFNDLKNKAEPLNLENWKKRSWHERAREWIMEKLKKFV